MRLLVSGPVVIGLSLCACGGPRIEGVVRSATGDPLPGVSISVGRVVSVATTDSRGRYSMEASGGPLALRYAREGFTTESLRLTLPAGASFPDANVVLYPVPPAESGAIAVGPGGTTSLPPAKLEHREQGSAASLAGEWVVAGADRAALQKMPAGRATLVVRAASEPVLYQLDEGPGAELVVSRTVSSWGIERDRQEKVVAAKVVRAGDEGVLVVSADLAPGLYLLRKTVKEGPFPAAPAASGWLFRVEPQGSQKAAL